jgi:hypothetical protein
MLTFNLSNLLFNIWVNNSDKWLRRKWLNGVEFEIENLFPSHGPTPPRLGISATYCDAIEWPQAGFGLVTRSVDHLYNSLLHFTNPFSTRISVLSLLQSPPAVSWLRLLTIEVLQLPPSLRWPSSPAVSWLRLLTIEVLQLPPSLRWPLVFNRTD